jgi:hypothetical protein
LVKEPCKIWREGIRFEILDPRNKNLLCFWREQLLTDMSLLVRQRLSKKAVLESVMGNIDLRVLKNLCTDIGIVWLLHFMEKLAALVNELLDFGVIRSNDFGLRHILPCKESASVNEAC